MTGAALFRPHQDTAGAPAGDRDTQAQGGQLAPVSCCVGPQVGRPRCCLAGVTPGRHWRVSGSHPRAGSARTRNLGREIGLSPRRPPWDDTIVMPDDPLLSSLVTRARNSDKRAWDLLVERCAPIVWSICRLHGLSRQDADDVGQSVWLRLVERI